jgi:putative transposase
LTEKYEFIDGEKYAYQILKMCQWLDVSKSGYYDWLNRPASATVARREELKALIKHSFDASDATYGYGRVRAELARWGITCGPELVRALMRELGLVPCQPRPARCSLTGAADGGRIPDLVCRDFTAAAPGEKLVGDITYIPTWEGWLYLATVIDCHTKAVIGWAMDDNYKTHQCRVDGGDLTRRPPQIRT